jgi:FkbM family methyltransferase
MHPRLHSQYNGLFRNTNEPAEPGEWLVDFGDATIKLPIRADQLWLDWDCALALSGHEPNVKRTYLALLQSRERPKLFVDIGANYGLHSLIFLCNGVHTVSFEPNPGCNEYFRMACSLNRVHPQLHAAVGEAPGETRIAFPERHTWLGSSDPIVIERLRSQHELKTITVEQVSIDSFVAKTAACPDLIKIDTEGTELAILRGARTTLQTCRPWLILESWPDSDRASLAAELGTHDYAILELPLEIGRSPRRFELARFLTYGHADVLAVPAEQLNRLPLR